MTSVDPAPPSPVDRLRSALRPRTRLNVLLERADDAFARVAAPSPTGPPATVLVTGIYRDETQLARAVAELQRSRHTVRFSLGAMGEAGTALAGLTTATHQARGKFQNVNDLLAAAPGTYDWLLVVDDDVDLPRGFLDTFLEVCGRLDLALAQPAQTRQSNANWSGMRRRALTTARLTRFVEIGPVTAIRSDVAGLLLPFPEDLRWGWGLDFHWAALVEQAGLRAGVVDLCAVRHASRKVASTYSWDGAQREGEEYLAGVPHLPPDVARETGRRRRLVRAAR